MKIIKMLSCVCVLFFSSSVFAMDQCNTTNQCKSKYGSKATDCKNSQSSNSICMCGSNRCDANSSGGSSGGSTSGGAVLYSENFNSKRAPWNKSGIQHGNYGKGGKGVRIKYVIKRGKNTSGKTAKGTRAIGGKKTFARTKSATLLYDIKFANDWNNNIGGKFNGLGPKTHVTGCKSVPNNRWSARVTFRDRVPSLYLYYFGKKARCGDQINQVNKKLAKNKWYRVALYVKINDKNSNNAIARLYIDGQRVAEKKNFKFHNSSSASDVDIQQFMLSTFLAQHVPNGSTIATQTAHFDNIKVVKGEAKK